MNNTYSREFKAKVVLESVAGEQVNPVEVARKYDVSPEQILLWAREMDISDANLEELSASLDKHDGGGDPVIELDTDSELFASEVAHGVTSDILNMKKLSFWGILGSVFFGGIVLALMAIFDYTVRSTAQQVSERSEYFEIRELKLRDQTRLSSFGVVDLEEGIYRIPVDSAISRMVQDD